MTTLLRHPNVAGALQRAGMSSPPPDVVERLTFACNVLEDGPDPDEILEISMADWANEDQGTDVLVIQTRDAVVLVGKGKRGRFKPMETFAIRGPYEYYQDVAEDDEMAGASVVFLAKDGHKPFLLSFGHAGERHRMFLCLFEAHAGHFSRWGLQLDPANYAADFDRYYAEICENGPAQTEAFYEWMEQQYGEFDISNALGLAADWRRCELDDAAGRQPSSRVGRIAQPLPWGDHPEARPVLVRLGEQLHDEGLLGPPYDERTFDLGDEPITQSDAGPARLLALMTLAAYANTLRDPRAAEWIQAANIGISVVPPTVFPNNLSTLWSEIKELPSVDDGPPAEIPIWEDVDVRAISTCEADRVVYSTDALTPSDNALVAAFLQSQQALNESESLSGEAIAAVALRGVATFEELSPLAPVGWRKLILYTVSNLSYDLWETHKVTDAATLAHWVVATVEANHWGPDGRTTPLGQHHSYMFGVAVGTGVGIVQIDPETGLASAPTGDEARRAAADGRF